MESFTPIASLIGGILIGISSALLLMFNGRIAGISGITGALIEPSTGAGERGWRIAFVLGLVVTGFIAAIVSPTAFESTIDRSTVAIVLAGLAVGFGTRTGSGCTSGHGVCGLGRLSGRSLAAVLTFITTGAITVFVVRTVFGGSV